MTFTSTRVPFLKTLETMNHCLHGMNRRIRQRPSMCHSPTFICFHHPPRLGTRRPRSDGPGPPPPRACEAFHHAKAEITSVVTGEVHHGQLLPRQMNEVVRTLVGRIATQASRRHTDRAPVNALQPGRAAMVFCPPRWFTKIWRGQLICGL